MAKLFLVPIDLGQNELLNAVIQNLSTAQRPANPKSGQIIYNTTLSLLEVYNGSSWVSAGGTYVLPVSDSNTLGGVKSSAKNSSHTVAVATDADGVMYVPTYPTLASLGAVEANASITGATGCKITYDSKGLVTSSSVLEASDIPDLSSIYSTINHTHSSLKNGSYTASLKTLTANTTLLTELDVGIANGVASLDASGLVPTSQLPSYVDDVIDLLTISDTAPATYTTGDKYYNSSSKKIFTAVSNSSWGTGATPTAGVIYVTLDTNLSYRWSGTDLVEISASAIHKYIGTCVGDGSTTAFTINHSLATRDVIINVYDVTTYDDVMVDLSRNTADSITVTFAVAPAVGTNYKVVIIA